MYSLIVLLLSVFIILLLLKRAKNRGPVEEYKPIFRDPKGKLVNLPWVHYCPPEIEYKTRTYKFKFNENESLAAVLSALCGIVALIFEIIDHIPIILEFFRRVK